MALNGTIEIAWGARDDVFCLARIKHILELEDTCRGGIALIHGRLLSGTWGVNDVREPIRLGLIGGGKSPEEAKKIVERHVDSEPLFPLALIAQKIIEAKLVGVPGDEVGKKKTQDETGPEAESSGQTADS